MRGRIHFAPAEARILQDRRTPDQISRWSAIEQERADRSLEELWRQRVRRNEAERVTRKALHCLNRTT